MSSLQIHKSRRPGDDPVKRARAVWKLCALTINMAAAMNFFIPNVEEFFETILSLFNQSNACLEIFALKKRLDNFVVWRAVGSGNLYSHSCCLG